MKILPLIFTAILLSACIRTDIGGTLADIGLTVPKAQPTSPNDIPVLGYHYTAQAYELNGEYYLEFPAVYVPQRGIGIEFLSPLTNPEAPPTYRRPLSYEELRALPTKMLTFKMPVIPTTKDEGNAITGPVPSSCQYVESFNKAQAKPLGVHTCSPRFVHALMLQAPIERTWYNYALRPLAHVFRFVDAASIFTLGPVSLPFVTLWEPDFLNPYIDNTGPYRRN